jgi:GNAT superfamily N-acetyltransferase
MPYSIRSVAGAMDIAAFRELCTEYARSLEYTAECASLEHQGIDAELAALPGAYGPPHGVMLLAFDDAVQSVGCVALRPIATDICEMKRMYVRPSARGLGVGRALARAIIDAARKARYHAMRLDTGASMTTATSLYQSLGFRDIPPYNRDPTPGTRWMELRLGSDAADSAP